MQVRVGIDYCAVNSFDVKCIYQDINTVTLPFIPGSEFSGEILEVGPKCKRQFKVGDKVAVLGKEKSKQSKVAQTLLNLRLCFVVIAMSGALNLTNTIVGYFQV